MRAPNRAGESNAVNSNFNVDAANDILSNGADRAGPVKNRSAVIANAFMAIFLPPSSANVFAAKQNGGGRKRCSSGRRNGTNFKIPMYLKPSRIDALIYSKL